MKFATPPTPDDRPVREFFALLPVTVHGPSGSSETRWLERVRVKYHVFAGVGGIYENAIEFLPLSR